MAARPRRSRAGRRDHVIRAAREGRQNGQDREPDPLAGQEPAPLTDFTLVVRGGHPLPIRTRLVGGPQHGRTDAWYTLAPEGMPAGWAFPRRVQTPEGEVLVEDVYLLRPGRVPTQGGVVLCDFHYSRPAETGGAQR
jgi:hypothetical protein